MKQAPLILLLAGTGEAPEIARALMGVGFDVIASVDGSSRAPRDMGCRLRIGGFGGEAGFRDWMAYHRPVAVIDACHPFATAMTDRTARICEQMQVPHLVYRRPAWTAGEGDQWHPMLTEADAAEYIPDGSTVFIATGRQGLDGYANLTRCTLICRQIGDAPEPFPFPNGRFLVGHPPFSVSEETHLFRSLAVDWLIVRNGGSPRSIAKLIAARDLGIKVGMIERPALPAGVACDNLDDIVEWARDYG